MHELENVKVTSGIISNFYFTFFKRVILFMNTNTGQNEKGYSSYHANLASKNRLHSIKKIIQYHLFQTLLMIHFIIPILFRIRQNWLTHQIKELISKISKFIIPNWVNHKLYKLIIKCINLSSFSNKLETLKTLKETDLVIKKGFVKEYNF